MDGDGPVLLFDGHCNVCNGVVKFILRHERDDGIRFASLQSPYAAEVLAEVFGADRAKALREGADGSGDPDTLVVVEGGAGYTHSSGALRVARHLRAPWRWALAFVVVPRFVRDAFYRFFARHRYRWFGKTDTCMVPTPEIRQRFLA